MVKKKDGSNRVCVEFRKLNKITEVDTEPMTTAEDLFCRLSGIKYLSKIDLTKGYWQIPVAPEDVYKTAYVTPDEQYVTSHVKMSPMLANIKSEVIPYLERVSFQLSNDVSFMFLGGFTHE